MAVAVPPDNAVDVFTNDVGFIAIVEGDRVVGYNMTVGGGMGVTHSNKKTYPRLGDIIGFVKAEDGFLAAEKIMLTQRDNGNRADRKNAVSQPLDVPDCSVSSTPSTVWVFPRSKPK